MDWRAASTEDSIALSLHGCRHSPLYRRFSPAAGLHLAREEFKRASVFGFVGFQYASLDVVADAAGLENNEAYIFMTFTSVLTHTSLWLHALYFCYNL